MAEVVCSPDVALRHTYFKEVQELALRESLWRQPPTRLGGERLSNLILSGSSDSPIKAPAVGQDGMLYVSGHDGFVRCVYPNTYQVKWQRL